MTEHRTPADLRDAADDLEGLPGVRDASVLEDDPRYGTHALGVTVGPEYDRTPPRVLRALADHDLGLAECNPQGSPRHHILVAL